MKHETRNAAMQAARELAAKLNTYYGVKSFKPHYHQNLGWYSSVRSKHINVWEDDMGYFHCLIGTDGCGMGIWAGESACNPVTAIRRTIASAAKNVSRYLNIVNGAVAQVGQTLTFETE